MTDNIMKSYHRVMSYELDSFGHVNNAVFLNYLEKARNDYLTNRGLNFKDFFTWEKFPVVIKALLEYKKPACSDQDLVINGWISQNSGTSFTLQYEVQDRDSGELLVKAETHHVFISKNNKPTRIPAEFREKFLS